MNRDLQNTSCPDEIEMALPDDFPWSRYAESRLNQFEAANTDPAPVCIDVEDLCEIAGLKVSELIYVTVD